MIQKYRAWNYNSQMILQLDVCPLHWATFQLLKVEFLCIFES